MRSYADARSLVVATAALLTMATSALHASSRQEAPAQTSVQAEQATRQRPPDDAEILQALDTVKADPNLATERTMKMLRWKDSTPPKPSPTPAWVSWITGLFRWLDQSARVLVWGTVAVLAALLVVFIVRLIRKYGVPEREATFVAPTHVRDLDIRPETLPADIGAAARALWDRGEHRASLALLYRGMLSRFAHVHRIPIRDSSTEGDCLELASKHLAQQKREYASRLVRVWQRFVYGREDVQAATVYVLCDDFASALNSDSPFDTVTSGGAA